MMNIKEAFCAIRDCCTLGLAIGLGFAVVVILLSLSLVFGNWVYYSLTDKPITTQTVNVRIISNDSLEQPVTNE